MKFPLVFRSSYDWAYEGWCNAAAKVEYHANECKQFREENQALKAEVTRLWTFINKNHSNKCQPRDKNGRWKKPVISEF